jgi:GDP/UDP-N,N'-diacetylbacillosamine 2-epimerase (hydrolysing)
MTRKICVVTGSRADYGLLKMLMRKISLEEELVLQIVVVGMHLTEQFGLTFKEIEEDGFVIDLKVPATTNSDDPIGTAGAIGQGVDGCARAFEELKPDLIVLLGDRFEIFAAATAALVSRIPIAHLHGGEKTVGSHDDTFRNCITKMSHLHFVANSEYQKRVIQLGEDPKNVYLVGGLGVDAIANINLIQRAELETMLRLTFDKRNLLITFHPLTLESNGPSLYVEALLESLSKLKDTTLIFTSPNIDNGGQEIQSLLNEFIQNHSNSYYFQSLGQLKYLSCMAQVDAVVGNSSSGITEAPSLRIGTINIGSRQEGRLMPPSVINCEPNTVDIDQAIEFLYTDKFQEILGDTHNPYGIGGASDKILNKLLNVDLSTIIKKRFFDL